MGAFSAKYAPLTAETFSKMSSARRTIVFSLGVGVVFLVSCLDLANVKIDDVFITLRYSRNLLAGQGAVFNPGEPVEAYSNPTWMLLITAIAAITGVTGHLAMFYLSKILCVVFGALTIVVMYKLARLRGNDFFATGLLVSVLAFCPLLNVYNISGMETSFVTFLLALTFFNFYRWHRSGATNYAVGFAIVLGILSISRPEGVIYPIAIFLGILVANRIGEQKLPLTLPTVAIVATIFVSSIAFRLWYYGDLMPTSFYAKNSPALGTFEDGVRYSLLFLGLAAVPYAFVALFKRARPFERVLVPIYAVTVAQFAFAVYAGGDWMPAFRLLLPVLPLLVFLVVDQVRVPREKWVTGVVLAALVIGVSSFVQREYINTRYKPISSGLTHDFEAYTPHYYSLAQELHEIAQPGQSVLVGEAGLIPYLNDELRFNDLFGLLDEHLAKDVDGRHFARIDNDHFYGQDYDYVAIITKRDKSTRSDDGKYDTGFAVVDAFLNDSRFDSRYESVYQEEWGIIFRRITTR